MNTPSRYTWFTNPLFVFIFSLLALVTSLFIYIRSYISVNESVVQFLKSKNLDPSQFQDQETWVVIVALSVLVAVIIVGLLIIFFYYQKMIQLYRLQQNFINGFTHELKTPIASLKLFLDTLGRKEWSRDEQLKYIEFMKRDTDRLSENVMEILKLAQIEEKQYRPQLQIINVRDLFENWLAKVEHLKEDCELNVDDTKLDSSWRIECETQLLEMLFSNFLTNAIDHGQVNKKTKLDIKFWQQNSSLYIEFSDNGKGMGRRDLKKIFRKFYQVGRSVKGSGLGLYMVQVIAKLHKGNVKAHSAGSNMGSRFVISLPLVEI